MRRKHTHRDAVTLLLVIALLTLFSAVALSFVFYAESQAVAAGLAREAEERVAIDMEPELLLGMFLNQLLFDARDDAIGVFSAIRGHSLLRNQWGADYAFNSDGSVDIGNNTVAFTGIGRLHTVYPDTAPFPLQTQDDFNLINYTYFPADGFLRDPERLGVRAGLLEPRGPFLGTAAVAYTYPDLNNLFLAAARADGAVLIPSFHRPWLFGSLDPANPNWTNPQGKYLILRPRPADHPPRNGKAGFPYPDDATGDVKNLIGPGGNDSIWLDLNAPVMTARDGRKFKPLFAPLILDLDGRINLNLHGNVRGTGLDHVSNEGWGPWEVNLARVLNAHPDEWKNLFVGGPWPGTTALGRYGPDRLPSPGPPNAAAFGPTPPFYSLVDFDSCQPNGAASGRLSLPSGTNCFPTFPAGYDNANLVERTNHPAIYNVMGPPGQDTIGYDRRFSLSNLEALLRHLDTGGPALTSDLFRLCPLNFANPRTRRLVTTDSYDLNRPGLIPWVWGSTSDGHTFRGQSYPSVPETLLGGGAKPFPANPIAISRYNDFTGDGRAGDAPLTRVDLNRPLPSYPPTDPATGQLTDIAGFLVAQQARQVLARDIFLRLVKAVGAYDPTAFNAAANWGNAVPPTPGEVNSLRWLAQYAVNIVDYIDSDDVITPFPWGLIAGTPDFAALHGDQWVFGTELPRVLLNEAYAEYVNIPGETGKGQRATRYIVHVWLELYNPLRTDPNLRDGGDARLDHDYEIVLTRFNTGLLSATDMPNVLGDPDGTGLNQRYSFAQVYTASSQFGGAEVLPTCDKAGSGFYLVGPEDPVTGVNPWDPGTTFGNLRKQPLTYIEKVAPGQVAPPPAPSVLLRRLACPGLPWQPDPTLNAATLPYNPYVTVDYMDNLALHAAITNNGAGFPNNPTPLAKRFSTGRVQPYDGNSLANFQQVPVPALTDQPQHTFFAHNQDAVFAPRPPFDWLVHLDRPVISPMEILHASSCKPHQLTHMFKDHVFHGYQTFNHAPYWLLRNPASPIYRAFEMLQTECRAGGTAGSHRTPGKINLNAIWDPEVFLALCDPQASNGFDLADIQQIYAWMLADRTPAGVPGPNDRPFKGLGNPFFTQSGDLYAEGGGIDETVLRANPKHPLFDAKKRPIRLFEIVKQPLAGSVIQDHPYQRYELLTKIANQVTTRGNVFAVWLTVGFFEVTDDTTRPVSLGAEIGRADGRHIRHRMFAVIDRSQLTLLFGGAGHTPITSSTPVFAPGPATVVPSMMKSMTAVGGNYTWSIRPGMILSVTGPDASGVVRFEDVVVSAVTPTSFTARFTRAYPTGFSSIAAHGNPGPRAIPINPAREPELIPYFTVIR